jgi:hypothetical protein
MFADSAASLAAASQPPLQIQGPPPPLPVAIAAKAAVPPRTAGSLRPAAAAAGRAAAALPAHQLNHFTMMLHTPGTLFREVAVKRVRRRRSAVDPALGKRAREPAVSAAAAAAADLSGPDDVDAELAAIAQRSDRDADVCVAESPVASPVEAALHGTLSHTSSGGRKRAKAALVHVPESPVRGRVGY